MTNFPKRRAWNSTMPAATKRMGRGKKGLARVSKKKSPTKNRTSWGWRYPDGREVCDQATNAGSDEYIRRRFVMAERQEWICGCGCGKRMYSIPGFKDSATFGHTAGRTVGRRDDRILINGEPYNRAERYDCNMRLGSPKRTKAGS